MDEPKYRTNTELADAFKRLAAQIYKDGYNYRIAIRKAGLIKNSDLKFPDYYRVNGTLQGLTIENIGSATLGLLEELLERGEEDVIRDQVALRAREDTPF
jgi:DNA polymerase/3'-5' exonuclease PolX